MSAKLVYGIGLNDAGYSVRPDVNGKQEMCQFYRRWANMLKRCYHKKNQAKYPTYIGCYVYTEWLTFSNFKIWMENQDWQGKELDKDLLFVNNKIYSPGTCVFVDAMTNSFTIDHASARGSFPLGVDRHKASGRIRARCNNPFTRKNEHLGYFNCEAQAHQAWKKRKHELAVQLATLQTDQRVASALRVRYAC